MQDDLFHDAIEQLLGDLANSKVVRAIEEGGSSASLWSDIEESGFANALLPEEAGGAGMGLADAYPLFETCGRHVLPVPLAQTAIARALLLGANLNVPFGAIALATQPRGDDPIVVTFGAVADWVLLSDGSTMRLYDVTEAERSVNAGTVDARLRWRAEVQPKCELPAPACGLRAIEATLLAAQMSGAIRRLLEMTLSYANDRQQFGRSIGKFQVIQHDLAVMAQHAEAARMAARMSCSTRGLLPVVLLTAVAKACTGEAVVPVTSIAHAIHGAIGITAEYDLQLFTRRLHAWRAAAGSEIYWHLLMGQALVDSGMNTHEFARTQLSPSCN
jgi:acyl-CoA dehydrogenase